MIDLAHLLHDGDIFAYRASAATDGRIYKIHYKDVDGRNCTTSRKYKKEADLAAVELDGTITQDYEPEPETHALHILKKTLKGVESDLINDGHVGAVVGQEVFLSNKGSFREKEVDITYKMNRAEMRRPFHLPACKQYLMNKWAAKCRAGELEADDMLAMRATELQKLGGPVPIICSIDKDLKQVPGWHWDFVKRKLVYVDEIEANRNFYSQLLTGDNSDGIVGLKGVGPKTAEKILKNCISPASMYGAVLQEWLKRQKREDEEEEQLYYARILYTVRKTARLLYLLREEGKHWEAPL